MPPAPRAVATLAALVLGTFAATARAENPPAPAGGSQAPAAMPHCPMGAEGAQPEAMPQPGAMPPCPMAAKMARPGAMPCVPMPGMPMPGMPMPGMHMQGMHMPWMAMPWMAMPWMAMPWMAMPWMHGGCPAAPMSPLHAPEMHTPDMPGKAARVPYGGNQAAAEAYQRAFEAMHDGMDIAYSGNPDRDFAAAMIPHHQGAIEMAKVVLQFGKDAQIRALAEDIIAAQEKEIATLKAWLDRAAN